MSTERDPKITFKVGLFAALGLILIAAVTVFVNDKPFWWRKCQPAVVKVADATGLKTKSPVRSLGIQIGYIDSWELQESEVKLYICITAPVELLPNTIAEILGEGFLGDKYVELHPVRTLVPESSKSSWMNFFVSSALAADEKTPAPAAPASPPAKTNEVSSTRVIPVKNEGEDVQKLVTRVNNLVERLGNLTQNIEGALNPQEMKQVVQQLNLTLENAAKTLSPEGGLTATAQRTLSKLEDAIEQLRQIMTRINNGEGSVGRLLNDDTYADEIHKALQNLNQLLGRVAQVEFVIDIGGVSIPSYDGSRGWFRLGIWPTKDRYYLLGATFDPRGKITKTQTTTTVGSATNTVETTQVEESGLLITVMFGKVLWKRLDLSIGVNHGDGTFSTGLLLGPHDSERRLQIINQVYSHSQVTGTSLIHLRTLVQLFPLPGALLENIYFTGGVDSYRRVDEKIPYYFGAGVSFTDTDIKLLFSFI